MKTYIWVMKDDAIFPKKNTLNPFSKENEIADWTKGIAIIKAYNHTEAAEILSYEIADLNKTLKPEYRLSTETEKLHLKELKENVGFLLPHSDIFVK